MKKICIVALMLVTSFSSIYSQTVVKLWGGNPPTDSKLTEKETISNDKRWIENVSVAEMILYPAPKDNNTGAAVLICPGGGYGGLAIEHEGHQLAQWLNTQGIAGIVLKYRMPNKNKHVPLEDVHQAMRYLRTNAATYGIKTNKIGIAGSSAGGHLAATASTHYVVSDGSNVRPDFTILFYPVITMFEATHGGSRANLLGEKPTQSELHIYSAEEQVNSNTPPAILLLSDDDSAVPPSNSTMYYSSLKKNNIPAAMYIFPEGGHGWGMNKDFKYHDQMLSLLNEWLNTVLK